MEEKTENLWHKSWPGFSAPQIYSEEMESTSSYETVLDSDTEDYFSCEEELDMEDDSGEAEIQEKGSITIQSGLHLLCALSQREDHEEIMGPCSSQSTDFEDTIGAPLSQNTVPEVSTGTGPSRDTESTIGHGPSQAIEINETSRAPESQNTVLEVSTGTGPPWESEESLNILPSWREKCEDTEGVLPNPNEDNLHGEKNQNPDRKKKRWRLKGLRKQIQRLCCCFFCCILTPTEEAPTPR